MASSTTSSTSSSGLRNVVNLILDDHRRMERMFSEWDSTADAITKKRLALELIRTISLHGAKEEMSIYPWMKSHLPSSTGDIDHSIEEHATLKKDLAALEQLDPTDANFGATLRKSWQDLKHHIDEEETNVLPKLASKATPTQLNDLAERFENMERLAPSRPHPNAPAEGVGAYLANASAKVFDKVRDAMDDAKLSEEERKSMGTGTRRM